MRFTAKHIELVPRADLCSNESSAQGRGTCFVSQWLNSNVIHPFNCTFPYMVDLTPPNVNVCHPAYIVRNYKQAVIARYNQDTVSSSHIHSFLLQVSGQTVQPARGLFHKRIAICNSAILQVAIPL
jgi:hypothetical protein